MFGVTKFHHYLYGRHFITKSDHQPLMSLLDASKVIPLLASLRIQRWALRLSGYRCSIRYKAGKSLDALYVDQTNCPSPPAAQLHPWEWPSEPWSRFHIDLSGPFMGHIVMHLILVDSHSKWLNVQIMKSITRAKTIEKLRSIFSMHGLPKMIVSDNRPFFKSKKFLRSNGIRHKVRNVPPINKWVSRASSPDREARSETMEGALVEEKLSKFINQYRITPHSTTGISSLEFLILWDDVYNHAWVYSIPTFQAR